MPNTAKPKRQKGYSDFYEAMPASYSSYNFAQTPVDDAADDATAKARRRMIRQGLMLLGLLIAQVILFAVLIHSTVGLG